MKLDSMDSNSSDSKEIVLDLWPPIRVYKGGRVERSEVPPPVPASLDPKTRVQTRDIIISHETGVSARVFQPKVETTTPLLFYFHGGGFCVESTFSPMYHNYLNMLASQAKVTIVSVEYRRAPEHPLPAAYHDCWDALSTKEAWIQEHVDLSRVYIAGDSAGANIAHQMALRVGAEGLPFGCGRIFNGMVLVHPFFWGKHRIGDEAAKCSGLKVPDLADKIWELASPASSSGADDPWINPAKDPRLSGLGCERVVVFIADKDFLRDRGEYYKEVLESSGWQGRVELAESKGEGHVFHLFNPTSPNSLHLMRKIVDFLHPMCCTL